MVFVNKRDDGFGTIDFSVCGNELQRELVYHLNLDIDMEEYGYDDEITKQVDKLLDICDNMSFKCFCPLGDAAVGPVASSIKCFRSDYEELIKKLEGDKVTA